MSCIVQVEKRADCLWIVLPDVLDFRRNYEIEESVKAKIGSDMKHLVIDLSNIPVLYSTGLGLLIRLRKMAVKVNGSAVLVNVTDSVRRLLLSVHFDRVFSIYTTDVEFELTQEKIWQNGELKFLFFSDVEDRIGRIVLSGSMTSRQDYSACSSFSPQKGIDVYIFDLSGLEILDSCGFRTLLSVTDAIRENGGECRAYGAQGIIRELLFMFGSRNIFRFFDSEAEAVSGIVEG
ncbi:MAG: STAS domain-containing protein [Chitinispirillaceae bacterium]